MYYKSSGVDKMIILVKYSTNNDLIFRNVLLATLTSDFTNTYLRRTFLWLHCISVRVRPLSLQQLTPLTYIIKHYPSPQLLL